MKTYEVAVIGAGWAGLSASFMLAQKGLGHIVLERGRVGDTWRKQRWASFHMNTPNVLTVLPGDRYEGPAPEGFMSGEDFISMLESYVKRHSLPVRGNTTVVDVSPAEGHFEIRTYDDTMRADALVVATGNLNISVRPAISERLPSSVLQLDGADYRDPASVPDGAILVVGCGDTGGQIAEELARAGRRVFLSTGRNGRVPRRYRGRDIFLWMSESQLNRRPRQPGASRALVGRTGTLSLQSLSALGVTLVGRARNVSPSGSILFDDSLAESAAFADDLSQGLKSAIDEYITREGIEAPAAEPDPGETVPARFPDPPITKLDLISEGIRTVIWATGLTGNFSWLNVPGAIDNEGRPLQERSLSVPGVYFIGLDNPEAQRSGTVLAAGHEAERIVNHLASAR